jgi:type IV secretory pathway TraG/TraD family ATPase VirD4
MISWITTILAAGGGAYFLSTNESLFGYIMFGLSVLLACTASRKTPKPPILKLGNLAWSEEDFCRGWLVTGETGSGKTLGGINRMLWEVSKNCPTWGGICIDDKGLYWETLSKMFAQLGRQDDLILLQVRPEAAPADWRPQHTFNYLDYSRLPFSSKAKDICDVAASLGQDGDQSFFKTQAQMQMEFAFQALQCAGLPVTLEKAYELLASQSVLEDVMAIVAKSKNAESMALLEHYHTQIANQPAEQLGGVRASLANRLKPFTHPDIVDVFCKKSSFSLDDLDRGKVICISVPQRFKSERRYINTLLKFAFFSHALLRFDKSATERKDGNLLVLWGDEAQKIVTANEDGTSDYNVLDVIREARATVVYATQSYTSLIPPLGEEKAKVLLANLANRITFKSADEDTAKIMADTLGKRKYKRRTYGYSGGVRTTSYTEEDKYWIEPHQFRSLKKFQVVAQHCERGFRRMKLPPIGPDGRVPSWY